MSFWSFTQTVQTRVVKFAIKRTLGPFFKHELTLDQLDVQVTSSSGSVVLHDIELNTEALNNLLGKMPCRILSGFIEAVTVEVHWQSLFQASLSFSVNGTHIEVELTPDSIVRQTSDDLSTSTLAMSQQIAADYLHENGPLSAAQASITAPDDASAVLTEFINRILSRVQIHAYNTTVAVRHKSPYSDQTVTFEAQLPELHIKDETPENGASNTAAAPLPTAVPYSYKSIDFSGLCIRCHELDDDVLLLNVARSNYIKLKLNSVPSIALPTPTYDIDCFLKNVQVVLSPHHLHLLLAFVDLVMQKLGPPPDTVSPARSIASLDSPGSSSFHTPLNRSRLNSVDGISDAPLGRSLGPADYSQIDHILAMERRARRSESSGSTGLHLSQSFMSARGSMNDFGNDALDNDDMDSEGSLEPAENGEDVGSSSHSSIRPSVTASHQGSSDPLATATATGTPSNMPVTRLQFQLKQLQAILWTVDSTNPPQPDSERPHMMTWADELLTDAAAYSVSEASKLPSHVNIGLANLVVEHTHWAHSDRTLVRLQSATMTEYLPASLLAPDVAEFSPFPVKPYMPVLTFTPSLPSDTTPVLPTVSADLASAMVDLGVMRAASASTSNDSQRPLKSALASSTASNPDIEILFEKSTNKPGSLAIKLKPMLLRLDLRILDRLQHFIVPPRALPKLPSYADDTAEALEIDNTHHSSPAPTALSFTCAMIRLDIGTPRVVEDETIEHFRRGLYLYPASMVVDIHNIAIETGRTMANLLAVDPTDLCVKFSTVLVCLRAPQPSSERRATKQYTLTAIALVDGGPSKSLSTLIVHFQNPHGNVNTSAPDAVALFEEHQANPYGFRDRARRMAKITVHSSIYRVVAGMDRSQFVVTDLIFNEATEWLPQFTATLAARAGADDDIVLEEAKSEDEDDRAPPLKIPSAHSRSQTRRIRPANANVHFLCLEAIVQKIVFTIGETVSTELERPPNVFFIEVDALTAFRVLQYHGAKLSFLHLTINDAVLSDISNATNPLPLVTRTTPAHDTIDKDTANQQVVDLLLTIGWDPDSREKEIKVKLLVRSLVLQYLPVSNWMVTLPALLEEAPMEGLYVQFAQRIVTMDVSFDDIGVQYHPKFDSFRAVLNVGHGTFTSVIIIGSPTLGLNLQFDTVAILLRDFDGSKSIEPLASSANVAYWQSQGYVAVLTSDSVTLYIRTGLTSEYAIEFGHVYIDTCADSFGTLTRTIDYIVDAKDFPRPPITALASKRISTASDESVAPEAQPTAAAAHSVDGMIDLFASVDDAAFAPKHNAEIHAETPIAGAGYLRPSPARAALASAGGIRAEDVNVRPSVYHESGMDDDFVVFEKPARPGSSLLLPAPASLVLASQPAPQASVTEMTNSSLLNMTASQVHAQLTQPSQPVGAHHHSRPQLRAQLSADEWENIDASEGFNADPDLLLNGSRSWFASTPTSTTRASHGSMAASFHGIDSKGKGRAIDLLSGSAHEPKKIVQMPDAVTSHASVSVTGETGAGVVAASLSRPGAHDPNIDLGVPVDAEYPVLTTPEESYLGFGAPGAPEEMVKLHDAEPLSFDEDYFNRVNTDNVTLEHHLPDSSRLKVVVSTTMICWRMYDGLDFRIPARLMRTVKKAAKKEEDNASVCAPNSLGSSPMPTPLTESEVVASGTDLVDTGEHAHMNEPEKNVNGESARGPEMAATTTTNHTSTNDKNADEAEEYASIEFEDAADFVDTRTASNVEMRAHWRFQKGRSAQPLLKVYAHEFSVTSQSFAATEQVASHLVISARDLKVRDLIPVSHYRHFLTYWQPGPRDPPRETGSKMFEYQSTSVRPNPALPNTDARLQLRILPLRFYVDQHAVDFLIDYFSFAPERLPGPAGPTPASIPSPETFYQQVSVSRVMVKVDYMPAVLHWDSLLEGNLAELINLFHIEGSTVRLPSVKLSGVEGFSRVLKGIQEKWVPKLMDPTTTGAGVASGISIVGSFVNLGASLLDMVVLPMQQYRKDGRTLHGLSQGAGSLFKTLTVETINLSTKLVVGTQMILLFADSAVSQQPVGVGSEATSGGSGGDSGGGSSASSSASGASSSFRPSFYAAPPANMREGATQGLHRLQTKLGDAVYSAFTLPMAVYHEQGAAASVRTALRALPSAMLKPLIGGVEAVGKVLLGMRHEFEPSQSLEAAAKYKRSMSDGGSGSDEEEGNDKKGDGGGDECAKGSKDVR